MNVARFAAAFACLVGLHAQGSAAASSQSAVLLAVRAVLATGEDRIDFAKAKLTFDKLIDPSIDVAAALRQLESMTAAAKEMAGPQATEIEKLRAVRRTIYVGGPWNGDRPFAYDQSDPYGRVISHKLLPRYLATRRGNCVSMPVLFLILADRLGVKVTLSLAPAHVFVKYLDRSSGRTYNLETTNGALPARDEWYRERAPMTDRAVARGVYLKALTRREDLAVLAAVVLESEFQSKRYRSVVSIANEILKRYPALAVALVLKGEAYAGLIGEEFQRRYPTPAEIPAELLPRYLSLQRSADAAFGRVDALGPMTSARVSDSRSRRTDQEDSMSNDRMVSRVAAAIAVILSAAVPSQARFLQSDPVGYVDDMDMYTYVQNDPTDRTDPTGQFDCVQTGDHTLQCTGHGLADIAAMYVWKAGVESGVIPPPPTISQSNGSSDNNGTGGNGQPGIGHNGGPPMNSGNSNNNNQNGPGLPSPVIPPPSSDNTRPSTPTGTQSTPSDVKHGTNSPTNISARDYSGHSQDRMQGRGIPPSAVENTIQHGISQPGNQPGTTKHHDPVNNITVITDAATGRVVTVRYGQ